MQKFKKYIVTGILLLVLGFVLTVLWFANIVNLIVGDHNADTLTLAVLWIYVLLFFQIVVYSGGLFLVIFFSIRGHKLDKTEQNK